MSLDKPTKNKMMQAPPAKKGFHFPSDGIHFAEFIEAETIEEATEIYHRIKRNPADPVVGGTEVPVSDPEQSTVTPKDEEEKGVQ